MGATPQSLAKAASRAQAIGVVTEADEQRRSGVGTQSEDLEGLGCGSCDQAAQLSVEFPDLDSKRLGTQGEATQRELGRLGGVVQASQVRTQPGAGRDDGALRSRARQPVAQRFRGGHDQAAQGVDGRGARLDRAVSRHAQRPDRLDATVGCLRPGSLAGKDGTGCGLGVDRIRFASLPSQSPIRARDLKDGHP